MIRSMVASAFGAAILAGLAVWLLQANLTDPLILEAEGYEQSGAASAGEAAAPQSHDASAADDHDDGAGWAPEDGLERSLSTLLGNVVVAFAISAMLLGAMIFAGATISSQAGLAWGLAGFAAFSLLPSIGLPPELPGTPAAPIGARQVWWIATVLGSVTGLGLIFLVRNWIARGLGVLLLALPHIAGAPVPPHHDVPYPGALAGEFATASMAVSAVLWCLTGLTVAWLYARLTAESGQA